MSYSGSAVCWQSEAHRCLMFITPAWTTGSVRSGALYPDSYRLRRRMYPPVTGQHVTNAA